MAGRNPDPYRKGGPHDDVARNIRNEMNRDAAPSPEEAKAEHQRFLSSKGCTVCGESDPEVLQADHPYFPNCSATQTPPLDNYTPDVWCEEHFRPASVRFRAPKVQSARHRPDTVAVAFYECGSLEWVEAPETPTHTVKEQVGRDEDGKPIYEEVEKPVRMRHRPRAQAPIECRCGSSLKDVVHVEEDVGDR